MTSSTIKIRVHQLGEPAGDVRWAGLLDASERERAARFRHDEDRRSYIAAHGLLRSLLGELTGRAPQDLRFSVLQDGKPVLVDGPGFDFSLSHSRGVVAVAVSPSPKIGVDVEAWPLGRGNPTRLAGALRDDEAAWIKAAEPTERERRLLEIWTLKEAAAKAMGRGLPRVLTNLGFARGAGCPNFAGDLVGEAGGWRFRSFAGAGYIGALALAEADPPLSIDLEEVPPGA